MLGSTIDINKKESGESEIKRKKENKTVLPYTASGIGAKHHQSARSAITLIIIFWADLRFTSLQGFLGIYEINYFWSVTITLITIVGLINCFNLVDGIDGLAAGVSSVSLITLGIWFGIVGQNELMMISFILAGALLSFIPYNVGSA